MDLNEQDTKSFGVTSGTKYAADTYDKNFGGKIDRRDITTVEPSDLPNHDLICGGFPCQAFSIAGKRKGFDETRGTLFFEIMRLARAKGTSYLFLENVKGLLNHDQGRTFETIIRTMDELGYDCQWQVLNSKDFGVPQNRERVFIIGHLRGIPRPQVFPLGQSNQSPTDTPQELREQVANTLRTNYSNGRSNETYIQAIGSTQANASVMVNQSPALTEAMGQGGGHMPMIQQVNQPKHSNDRVYGDAGIAPTLNTMQGGRRQPKVAIPVLTPDRKEKRQNGRRMKENGEPAFTLNTQDIHGISDGSRIRRLTPIECERLQGFPDGWTEGVSDTQRYKQMGNAVTVNVIEAIAKKLSRMR